MTLYQILTDEDHGLKIPCVYSHFRKDGAVIEPPYVAYIGSGQDTFKADDTIYHKQNTYQIEYYFTEKNEATESSIEEILLANGFIYEKSEDLWIEDEGVFVIYYYV